MNNSSNEQQPTWTAKNNTFHVPSAAASAFKLWMTISPILPLGDSNQRTVWGDRAKMSNQI
jgi:hypothetical protein